MAQLSHTDSNTGIDLEGSSRVLLVDDDAPLLNAMARALRRSGLHVTMASSGREALEMLRAVRFDAVVTDIAMPEMNGIALVRAVRAADPTLHVILITGAPTLQTAIAAIDEGAFKYVNKPFEVKALTTLIERASALSRLARAESRTTKAAPVSGLLEGDDARSEAFAEALAGASVVYQPLLAARTGEVVGFEALLRSGHPRLADPRSFLFTAERLGRLTDLARFVRTRAEVDFRGIPEPGWLFLNVHPKDLLDPALVDWGGGLLPIASRVVLEISEHADFTGVPNACLRVASLRKMGFRIALDDIGAADAGIARFSRFEPDFLKLDMSLVRDIDEDDAKRRVASAIVGFARDLGMSIVAEGVETEAESRTLIDLECDLVQGYLFARPGPAFPAAVWPHEPPKP